MNRRSASPVSRMSSTSPSTAKQVTAYVLEFQGSVVRVRPAPRGDPALANSGATCARYGAGQRTTVASGLTMPTSVEVGPDGAVYVSNRGTFTGAGQVIRFAVQID